ncbi:unnamed protein product, partial [Prorocentrum cordatum]
GWSMDDDVRSGLRCVRGLGMPPLDLQPALPAADRAPAGAGDREAVVCSSSVHSNGSEAAAPPRAGRSAVAPRGGSPAAAGQEPASPLEARGQPGGGSREGGSPSAPSAGPGRPAAAAAEGTQA